MGATSTSYPGGASGLPYSVHSPDMVLSFSIDLADVGEFGADFFGGYTYRSDLFWDGVVNLADLAVLGTTIGSECLPPTAREVMAATTTPATEMSVLFEDEGRSIHGLKPGRRVTANLVLLGPAAIEGIQAFDARLRVSDNVVVHGIEIAGGGLNLAGSDDLVVALPSPMRSAGDAPLVLARITLSVTDMELRAPVARTQRALDRSASRRGQRRTGLGCDSSLGRGECSGREHQ